MHEYSGGWIPVRASFLVTGIVAYVVVKTIDVSALTQYVSIKDPVLLVAVSELFGFGVILQLLNFVTDRWLWKLMPWCIPDLSGEWICEGVSSFEGRQWSGRILICQRSSSISVLLESGESKSRSSMAKMSRDERGDVHLEVVFRNSERGATKSLTGVMQSIGFAEYVVDLKKMVGSGEYAISAPRHNTGTIKLRRA